jgi:hypothetical protein
MSVRDLQDSIKKAQRIIQEWDDNNRDPREDETRRELIDPVLMALGWPVKYGRGNRKPCITEYYPYKGSGLRVDYAMFDDGDNEAILVEAKRFSEHTKTTTFNLWITVKRHVTSKLFSRTASTGMS